MAEAEIRGRVETPERYLLNINSDLAGLWLLREAIECYIELLEKARQVTWITHEKYQAISHNMEQLARLIDRIREVTEDGETTTPKECGCGDHCRGSVQDLG